ncbi:MAG TPA: caspase family protein, partial [Pyrinomonadaceae bacterium]
AFNRDNVKSKDAQLPLTGSNSLKRSGTTYILAVGLNEYANAQYNLKYAVADAQSFSDELSKKISQVSPSGRIEIIPLINQNATKANILSALRRLSGADRSLSATANLPDLDRLKRAQPEDTIVIFFAGHGTAQGKRFYLIPHDLGYTGKRSDLTEQSLKILLSHSISDIELEQALENVEANHFLLLIDACNSGQALETEEKRRGPMNSKGLAQLAYEKGMYVLTAAQSYQAAMEVAQLGHGLLTYALVEEGLKTGSADSEPKDGVLTAREWLDHATERVPQLQEDKIKESRGLGLELSFTEGDQAASGNPSLQRPRSFYRRELETNPLVIAGEKTNLNSRVAPATATSPNTQVGTNGLARWIDLQTATLVTRYRWIKNSDGVTTANNIQAQMQFRGRFKFDKDGAYSLNAGVFPGNNFINGFNDTGIGTGQPVTNLYLKQLFLSAKPITGVEVQYGGLYFQRGESSEITTYDNDGYLMGERIIIQRPRNFFFDEVAATFA